MLNNDVIDLIGPLALKLHIEESDELNAGLSDVPDWFDRAAPSEDYKIEGNTVCFASRAARNRVVAAFAYAKQENEFAKHEVKWIPFAYDLWRHEIGQEDSAAGRLLALVHEKTDVLTIGANAITSKTIEVFRALNTIEAALPYLNTLNIDGIEKLSEAQHELTKGDIAAGSFFAGLGKTIVRYPDFCRSIYHRLRERITEATADLYPRALVALASSAPQESVSMVLQDAESEIDLLRSTAAGATLKTDAFVDELTKLGRSADQESLPAIAHAVWANLDDIKIKSYFPSWLRYLCKLPVESKDIIEQFDHVLSRLLSDASHQDLVLSCLAKWITVNGRGGPHDDSLSEYFQMSTIELARHPILLSRLITDWLLTDNRKLPSAAAGLLRYLNIHGLDKPELSVEKLDSLQPSELLFLARRLLGFVFYEDHLLSLSMSFFKTREAPTRTFPILHALLVDEVGYDYPSSTIEALDAANAIEERLEFKAFYSDTIQALRSRMTALDDLPRLTELRPSPTLQRQFAKARAKQMSKGMMSERKKSILRQIVTEVPIKAGIGWFSFRDGAFTEPSYLKSISHSVELPRRHTLDTVGSELRLWSMSQATRDDS